MIERSPTEFRSFYYEWKKTAPPNDSDVIPAKPRRAAFPRHADLSKELQGLLFWRHINKEIQPLSTNWMVPDNDNDIDKEDDEPRAPVRSKECEHVIRPSVDELMKAVENVEYDCRYRQIPGAEIPEECWPLARKNRPLPGPDVEYGEESKACAPLSGYVRPIARMGSIRFATEDSDQNGRNQSPTRGAIVSWHAGPNLRGQFPVDDFGAPLGSHENQEDIDSSNQFFSDLLNAQPHRYITGGICRRIGGPALPSKDNRPALPCGSRRVSDSFIGHKISSECDDCRNDEPADEWIVRIQERSDIRAQLSTYDVKALDTAIHASNFQDIGEAFDFRGKTAERQGKRLLLAATSNLSALIDKVAA
jgi:hypothetical protein